MRKLLRKIAEFLKALWDSIGDTEPPPTKPA
jgi:hypothetical protein